MRYIYITTTKKTTINDNARKKTKKINNHKQKKTGASPLLNCVVCETVLKETAKNDLGARNRLLALMRDGDKCFVAFPNENHLNTFVKKTPEETDNDYSDRLIRNVAYWFGEKLKNKVEVMFLSDDAGNLEKFKKENDKIPAYSMSDFIKRFPAQEMKELISWKSQPNRKMEDLLGGGDVVRFPHHLDGKELTAGIISGKYKKGSFKVVERNEEACVLIRTNNKPEEEEEELGDVESSDEGEEENVIIEKEILNEHNKERMVRISIEGSMNMNRAIDGDVVAIELIGERKGKVVGIIQRKLRPFVGTILVVEELENKERMNLKPIINADEMEEEEGKNPMVTTLFVPMNQKIPKIQIQTSQLEHLKNQR